MYACHVSSTVTCRYILYIENLLYITTNRQSLFSSRVTPHLAARHEGQSLSVSCVFLLSIERYKIIYAYTILCRYGRLEFPDEQSLRRERNISCELTAKKLPRQFFVRVTFRAHVQRVLHTLCTAIVAEGLRFESCDQNERNREEVSKHAVSGLANILCCYC